MRSVPPLLLTLALLGVACTRSNPQYRGDRVGTEDGGADSGGAAPRRDLGPDGWDPDDGLPPDPDGGGSWPPDDAGEGHPTVRFAVQILAPDSILEDHWVEILVTPLDADGRPNTDYRGTPSLRPTRGGMQLRWTARPPADPEGRLLYRARFTREGELVVKVSEAVAGGSAAGGRTILGESPLFTVRHGTWLAGGAPVLAPGEDADAWDAHAVTAPDVLATDWGYTLFYRGQDLAEAPARYGIGRADLRASGDGLWSRERTNPLLAGPSDYSGSSVLRAQAQDWRMWVGLRNGAGPSRLAHLHSEEGLRWRGAGDPPVLLAPAGGGEAALEISDPAILYTEGVGYEMWYTIRYADRPSAIGFARSVNGLEWTPSVQLPVLAGGAGEWDGAGVAAPTVLRLGGVYRMWFAGARTLDAEGRGAWHIGYATSADGVQWQKSPDNPVLRPGASPAGFDQDAVAHPSVTLSGGSPFDLQPVLFYAGRSGERWSIGQAEGRVP